MCAGVSAFVFEHRSLTVALVPGSCKVRFIYIVAPKTVTLKPYKNIYALPTHIFVSHCSCIVLL